VEYDWVVLMAAAALALTGTFGIAWRTRARAATRWLTALDAYADREIARDCRRKALRQVETRPAAPGMSGEVSAAATSPGELLLGEGLST
jgi:hypothetical protein